MRWRSAGVKRDRLVSEAAIDPVLDAAAAAVREVEQAVDVVGTPTGDWPNALRREPWHLVDARAADPESNWPGDLIGRFDDIEEAYRARARLVALAVLRAASGGKPPYLP